MSNILPNIQKEKGNDLLTVGICSVVFGVLCNRFYPIGNYAYGFGALGLGTIATHFLVAKNKMKILFENCNLHKGGVYPLFKEKLKTDYGYSLRYTLPIGLSTDDFKKKKKAIEEFFNHRVEIHYAHKNVILQVYEKELQTEYKYESVPVKGAVTFPVGYSFKKMQFVDLSRGTPHLLIAGETGSGKSTLLRSILYYIITTKSLNEVRLHLIDMKKGAEFQIFSNCHMVETFSRTREEAESTLIEILKEADRRWNLFFANECVDIKEYNQKFPNRKLNYQIVAIDEFAQLQEEKDSLYLIENLAATARACGIHLIISTQRPDSKILNGRIKANVGVVCGLKTMNETNSRIIIDRGGLEYLRGYGHGILRYEGEEIEFQGMNLSAQEARSILQSHEFSRPRGVVYLDQAKTTKKQTSSKQTKRSTGKATKSKEQELAGQVDSLDFLKKLDGYQKNKK